jgi:class 3 adenylate cyclase
MEEPMIEEFLNEIAARVADELRRPVDVEDCDVFPGEDDLYLEKRTWKRMKDVVVVAADLKGSTKLNFDKYAPTSASLYEALTGNMVRIVESFQPEFVDIQGDGLFALFYGDMRYQRAFCGAVTLKTFSERVLMPAIEDNMSERFPETGLKLGMSSGILVAKRVGIRRRNEPVWAGKPVNWAVKCAQSAGAHELVVTQSVFQKLEDNDYVVYSCGCPSGNPTNLWREATVNTLPEEDGVQCRLLRSNWCVNCGDLFCQAILDGDKQRDDVSGHAA